MDKERRRQITRLKHLKRCKRLGLKPEENYCYKHQAKPCNCWICKGLRFNRNIKHKNDDR